MNFFADKQTLDDLNLLGRYKPGAIFSIFNKVHTRGGEKLLEEMFRHPLTDAGEINRRSSIFLYFKKNVFIFPFNREQFSVVADYLGAGSRGNGLTNMVDVARKYIMHLVAKDEAYVILRQGVTATIRFIDACRQFVAGFDGPDKGNPLVQEIMSARNILEDRRLVKLSRADPSGWQQLAMVHHLLTHVLQEEMSRLCDILYQVDVYISVSKTAEERGFSYAHALPEEEYVFHAADLRHPSLDKAVGNPISLDQHRNVLFLTGANMAGKSTFMKSFGIALYLGHMGFPVAANEMVFSVKEGLYSSINVPDNLSLGHSHFYAEVQRVRTIAEEVSRSRSLVIIFDELFKGTNVKDAFEATLAVTDAFAAYRNCCFIISTHIIEVGEALRRHDNLQFSYLPTVMEGSTAKYTYQLREGITSDRHGMMIIGQEGILDIIRGTAQHQDLV
jgi:DNA mismatch repair protein MutS